MRRTIVGLAVAALVAAAAPGILQAQGFQVNEHGTCVMGRAGTGVASPCADASSIFFNPAGLAVTPDGWTISAGVTVISAFGGFDDDVTGLTDDLQNNPIPVPHFYGQYGRDKWAVGIGAFVPYGLGTKWTETFEGRFNGYDNDLRSIYIQPTAAYKVNDWLSLGAGLDIVIGSLELNQYLDFSTQEASDSPLTYFGQLGIPFHTQFATGSLHASGATGFGGNFGVWVQPIPQIEIGARYLTRVKLDYEGTAAFEQVESGVILPPNNPIALQNPALDPSQPLPLDVVVAAAGLFAPGAPLSEQTVTTSITMPDQFTIGVAWQVNPRWKVLADYQWVHWGLFQSIEADFEFAPDLSLEENYSNTSAIRLGVDWMTSEMLSLRGGYLYHQGAAPSETVTPLLPEGDRNEFTLGAGLRFGENWTLDLAYQFINQDKRRGRVREPFPGDSPTVELNSGLYTFNAHLFAATIAVNF